MKITLKEFFLHESGLNWHGPPSDLMEYRHAVLCLFVPEEQALDILNSDQEEATIADCMRQGMSPEECARVMRQQYRWQDDRPLGDEDVSEHQIPLPQSKAGRSAVSSPSQEVSVHRFFTKKDGSLGLKGIDEGRPVGSKNKDREYSVIPGHDVDVADTPDELGDDDPLFADMDDSEPAPKAAPPPPPPEEDTSSVEDDFTFSREDGDLGDLENTEDDEFAFLDDPNFGKDAKLPDRAPRKISSSDGDGYDTPPPQADVMEWEQFREMEPEAAEEAEQGIPADQLQGATFKKKPSGFMMAIMPNGARYFHMGPGDGWEHMED